MDERELAYAAGLFDGEGTIMVRARVMYGCVRQNHSLTVKVCNTNLTVIDWFDERWPGHREKTGPKNHPTWRQAYSWITGNRKAQAFLKDILPYLIIKRREAELGIALQQRIIDTPRGYPLTDEEVAAREAIRQELLDQPGRRIKTKPR